MRHVSKQHPTWGYEQVCRQLKRKGWDLNRKRAHRVWRDNELGKRPKARRKAQVPGNAENSIWAHPSTAPNDVWAIDFKQERLSSGRKYRVLNVFDEYTRRAVGALVQFSVTSSAVEQFLQSLFRAYGKPRYIRTDNGPEFITQSLADWAASHGIELRAVDVASPQQNGLVEAYHKTMEAELLGLEHFDTILEARTVINNWRQKVYNSDRPHGSLQGRTPNEFMEACRRARRTGDTLPQPTPRRRPRRAGVGSAPAEG